MSKQLSSYIGLAVLFAISFFALHWVYGYVVVIQSETNDGFFMFGRQFLLEFLDRPAGLLRYAGRFLSQFYHYQWLGALIVSTCIACFGVFFHRILVKLNGAAHVSQTLLPCLLLLALHTSTVYVIHDTLGLLASCGAFLGFLLLRGKVPRRLYALVITPIIYLLLGVYAWFFVAWIVAFEWIRTPLRSGLFFKIAYPVFSIAMPLVAWRWMFMIPLRSAVVCPIMFGPPFRTGSPPYTVTHVAMDCFLAVVLSVSVLLIPFSGQSALGKRLALLWRTMPKTRKRVSLAVVLLGLVLLFHAVRYDARLATFVTCHRLYKQEQWDALLEKAKKNAYGDSRLQFMTNFALSQKGRLLDDMFNYPQMWGTRGLVFNFSNRRSNPSEDDRDKAMYNSDLFYEMGHINVAFRHAYDYMRARGRSYEVLKRMAQCSMVNGNYPMAAKYLNMLDKTIFHRGFARRFKAIIADAEAVQREFGDIRERLPVVDVTATEDARVQCSTLLENKNNRMAFDYLTAWFLLDKREISIATIGANVEHFKTAGYASMPTHCQEALLLLERSEGTSVDLRGFGYDEATTAGVAKFFQDASTIWSRRDAPKRLQALHGHTYMFYHAFVATPSQVRGPRATPGHSGGAVGHE